MTAIRLVHVDDAPEIARLAGELGYSTDVERMRLLLAELDKDEKHDIAVAENAGAIVGWLEIEERCSLAGGRSGEITGLVVSALARRSGAGRALVAWARAWAALRGLERLRVRSNAKRTEAAEFYPAVGFALEKTQRVYVADWGNQVR